MRRVLPPGAAVCGALVVILAVVRAVPFLAEMGVLECMRVRSMDAATWDELMKARCCEGWESDEGCEIEVSVGGGRG